MNFEEPGRLENVLRCIYTSDAFTVRRIPLHNPQTVACVTVDVDHRWTLDCILPQLNPGLTPISQASFCLLQVPVFTCPPGCVPAATPMTEGCFATDHRRRKSPALGPWRRAHRPMYCYTLAASTSAYSSTARKVSSSRLSGCQAATRLSQHQRTVCMRTRQIPSSHPVKLAWPGRHVQPFNHRKRRPHA